METPFAPWLADVHISTNPNTLKKLEYKSEIYRSSNTMACKTSVFALLPDSSGGPKSPDLPWNGLLVAEF